MLGYAVDGHTLLRTQWSGHRYDAVNGVVSYRTGITRPTVRALAAHELLAWDGGALDPERKAVVTERGRFVFAHGREKPAA